MLKVGETRDQRGTPLRNDQVRPLMARMVRTKTNERSARLRPIVSYMMGHTGRGTADSCPVGVSADSCPAGILDCGNNQQNL